MNRSRTICYHPFISMLTDRAKAMLLLWIIYVISVLSCASVY